MRFHSKLSLVSKYLIISVLLFDACPIAAVAQTTIFPAHVDSYVIKLIDEKQIHAPNQPGNDVSTQVHLERQIPQIVPPVSPSAAKFNSEIKHFIADIWTNIGAPKTNNPRDDQWDNEYYIWAGVGPSEEAPPEAWNDMLPGVLSVEFEICSDSLGGAHGSCFPSDFNWLIAAGRVLQPEDLFDATKNWKLALGNYLIAQSQGSQPGDSSMNKYIVSTAGDPNSWFVTREGLRVGFTSNVFDRCECGGDDLDVLVPWSALAPYLKKGGLVQQPR